MTAAARFTGRDLPQLRALARSLEPLWGATPYDKPDGDILRWLQHGWIERVSEPIRGYIITDAGRAAVAEEERSDKQRAAVTADHLGLRWLQTSPTSRTLQVRHDNSWIDIPTVDRGRR